MTDYENIEKREIAHELMLEFLDNLPEEIENAHCVNAVKTDNGHCIEIARNIAGDKYIYLGVLFGMGFCWVQIEGYRFNFNLFSEDIEKVITTFEDYMFFE